MITLSLLYMILFVFDTLQVVLAHRTTIYFGQQMAVVKRVVDGHKKISSRCLSLDLPRQFLIKISAKVALLPVEGGVARPLYPSADPCILMHSG